MIGNAQDVGKVIYDGLYRRAIRQIRSWSWGRNRRKSPDLSEVESKRPWAGVAEWLRVAHSLLDETTVELTRNADR